MIPQGLTIVKDTGAKPPVTLGLEAYTAPREDSLTFTK